MAQIIDGKKISQDIKDELKEKVTALKDTGTEVALAVIQVGNDPASSVYVRNKKKACEYIGIRSLSYELPEETTEDALIELIEKLNKDETVNGILVQLPVPKHIDPDKIIRTISPEKDVDGFHPQNVGKLVIGEADAKESLVINIFIPVKYIGKIELSVNAGTLNITDIENEHIEVNGKISEVTLQGNKSEIEIDSNLDMQISVLSHEGALEINQLSATSRLTLPADYRFRSTKKGIATHIYYERQGKKVDDFSDAEADNYIELNGIKSELVIVEAEV